MLSTEHKTGSIQIAGSELRYLDSAFILLSFVFLYLHLFLLPNTPIYYEHDHVALLNDARRMLNGEIIYRDFFEFTFPGSHVLYVTFLYIFGAKYWIANFLILMHGIGAVVICLLISRRVIGANFHSYLPAAIYLFFGFRWFGIDGEHRFFSQLFAYLAVLLLLTRRTYARIAFAGIACAASSFFTQHRGVLACAAIGLFFLIKLAVKEKNWALFLKSSLVLSVSFLVTIFAVLLPFVILAGADVFYTDTLLFISNYVQEPNFNRFGTYVLSFHKINSFGYLVTAVTLFYYALIPLIYIVIFVFLWINRKNSGIENKDSILLVCLVGAFFALGTAFAPSPERLFQIAIPALILLAWLINRIPFMSESLIKGAIILLVVFGLMLGVRIQVGWDVKTLSTPSGEIAFLSKVIYERYAWLSEHANAGDLVYEAYNSHVNFPLQLDNPSSISVLLNGEYNPQWQVDQAIDDLKAKKVRYIIWDGAWTAEMNSWGKDEKLRPFYMFLTKNYELRQKFTPYDDREREIWEIKNAGFTR